MATEWEFTDARISMSCDKGYALWYPVSGDLTVFAYMLGNNFQLIANTRAFNLQTVQELAEMHLNDYLLKTGKPHE